MADLNKLQLTALQIEIDVLFELLKEFGAERLDVSGLAVVHIHSKIAKKLEEMAGLNDVKN